MQSLRNSLAFSYLRLSKEEAQKSESTSIASQRLVVENYCKQNGITLVREFTDDGYSGANFNRPGFQRMMNELEKGSANTIITKDLSRLGRDMAESSYYAEQFFPEHQIHYIAIGDNFDSERENVLAPFQFAMNEVYLRDGSRKIKEVLKSKREQGQYCCCPPYGYMKSSTNKNLLVPDPNTAPIVARIFNSAAKGDSSRKIALDLTSEGVIPPLLYRVTNRDTFSEKGASRATDYWCYTTVKRILKNKVYLGHTLLGKTKKASVKSNIKIPVERENWAITENTHEPIVTETLYKKANDNLGKGSKDYRQYEHVRKSIFSGLIFCSHCGYALCSCGTVYKGEREKYWYLSCGSHRDGVDKSCGKTRINYADLKKLITDDLNSLISLSESEIEKIVRNIIAMEGSDEKIKKRKSRVLQINNRLKTIEKMITKLYESNAEGMLEDERLYSMVDGLQNESIELKKELFALEDVDISKTKSDNYKNFFELVKNYTHIDVLDRDTVLTFIDKIEVGPKVFEDGYKSATHKNTPFKQEIKIFYKFIGEMDNCVI